MMIPFYFLCHSQVLPLAHTSGKDRTEVQIINPQAANLSSYEEKLKAMIELYKRFLSHSYFLFPSEKSAYALFHLFSFNFSNFNDIIAKF